MKHLFSIFILCLLVFSCGTQKRATRKPKVVTTKKTEENNPVHIENNKTEENKTQEIKKTTNGPISLTTEEYIKQFSVIAIEEMKL
jgi:hypothetical protein